MVNNSRIASCLILVSLIGWGAQVSAQRSGGHGRGGGAHHAQSGAGRGGGAHHAGGRGAGASQGGNRGGNMHANSANRGGQYGERANRGGQYAQGGNRNYSGNRNHSGNRNTNVNYNRNANVNVNRNVNVNAHWNGNRWGGSRVYAPHYAWPHGYGYVHRSIGWVMPGAFLTSAYFYAGWATLGLTAPPPEYQWVRYGPDLLLVNTVTGQVTDARYGVFAG